MKERLKALRKNPKIALSQEAFGARLGLTGSAISLLESGRNKPTEQLILSICREYGVNEAWLRTGEGEMFVETADDALREIIRSRGLGDEDYDLLCEFINLSPEDRKTLIRIIRQLAGRTASYSIHNRPRNPHEMTDEEIHAELDRQLAEEKRQAENVSVSGRGGSGTAAG